ncbi:MAG: AMP-binding protein [Bradyrhizobiaceae bacterium]|nr:AMP-binding protein [Bradyrhizobiaceae bacterium]
MNLGYQILAVSARRFPQHAALLGPWGDLDYAQLEQRVAQLAGGLLRLGIKAGDRVAFMMNNRPEVVIAYFAILRVGAIAVAVNVMLKRQELAYLLNDSETCVIVCEPATLDAVLAALGEVPSLRNIVLAGAAAPEGVVSLDALAAGAPMPDVAEREPDDIAMMLYTSGTTGEPKGVMMSHFWLEFVSMSWVNLFKLTHDDRALVTSPFFYTIGLVMGVLAAFRIGASAVLLERFKPHAALEAITRFRPTTANIVPTAVAQLLDNFDPAVHDVSSMKTLFSAGAAFSAALRRRVRETFGWESYEIYGLTEAHMLAAGHAGLPRREGMIGVPGANVTVRVVDDQGRDVARGEVGELVCKGDTVTLGYWRRPQATAEAYRDGWFHTGDLGIMDEDGYIRIVDRKKEMIITGGANIYPAEVEKVLAQHPAVAMGVLVGVPDEQYGELPVAVVALRPGASASADDLIGFCRDQLAVFKCPRSVIFIDELPITATGKVARRQLRDQLEARAAARPAGRATS